MSYVHLVESHSLNISCRNFCMFSWDVLFENYPFLEFHHDFIYCKIFRRVVKF